MGGWSASVCLVVKPWREPPEAPTYSHTLGTNLNQCAEEVYALELRAERRVAGREPRLWLKQGAHMTFPKQRPESGYENFIRGPGEMYSGTKSP